MKNLPIVILLLVAFSLGCSGLMNRFTKSSSNSNSSNSTPTGSGSTSSGSEAAPPSGDPKADVIAASKKLIDLPQFAAKMQGQGKTNIQMELEYQAPDHFHMTSVGGASEARNEMVVIGKDFYMSYNGKWMKMPNSAGMSMPNIKQYFDEQGLKMLKEVDYVGEDTIDGKPMHVYRYHSDQVNANTPMSYSSKIWVGSGDGLPHRIELTYDQGELKSMTVNYDFDKPVDIKAPI